MSNWTQGFQSTPYTTFLPGNDTSVLEFHGFSKTGGLAPRHITDVYANMDNIKVAAQNARHVVVSCPDRLRPQAAAVTRVILRGTLNIENKAIVDLPDPTSGGTEVTVQFFAGDLPMNTKMSPKKTADSHPHAKQAKRHKARKQSVVFF